MINDFNIQVAALNKTMDFMGSDFWLYEIGTRKRYKWRAELMKEVREACAFRISYSTLRRWICYYQKYGEVPAKSRRHRPTIKGQRTVSDSVLPANYKETLKQITEEKPQLYLDEIQVKVFHSVGSMGFGFPQTSEWGLVGWGITAHDLVHLLKYWILVLTCS